MDIEIDQNIDISNELRPQVATEIDKHSHHLTNWELDTINKIYYENKEKNKEKNILDLTLNEIIDNTVKFLINFDNHYDEIIYEIELKNNEDNKKNDFMVYIYAFMIYLNKNKNIFYLGIIFIIISIILYFFNII